MHKLLSWCVIGAVALSTGASALADEASSSGDDSSSSSASSEASSETSSVSDSSSSSLTSSSSSSSSDAWEGYSPCAKLKGSRKMLCVRDLRNARLSNKIQRMEDKSAAAIDKLNARTLKKIEKLQPKMERNEHLVQCRRLRDGNERIECMRNAFGASSSSSSN